MPSHWKLQLKADAPADQPLESGDVRMLALFIRNNRHLKRFLHSCKPQNRKRLYDAMKPHLGFRVWPYWMVG